MKIQFTRENKKAISKGTVGLFIEDLNYALDGGLNAEMLENPNFEAKDAYGKPGDYTAAFDGGYAWEAFPCGDSAALKVKTDRALFPENPHYMRLAATAAGGGNEEQGIRRNLS